MLLRICGLGVVLLALAVTASPRRDAIAALRHKSLDDKEVVGKIKEVNAKKKSFIVALEDKSDRPFMVNKETKFTGPRGADREEGLQDPCMGLGYEVHVVPGADAKYAKEVKLSAWKGETKKKKKGGE